MRGSCVCSVLCWLFYSLTATANPFVQKVERASPGQRIRLILNYFDTCQAVIDHPSYAFRTLNAIRSIGQKTDDEQLLRYVQYLKDTYPKHHNRSHADNAALFLGVGQRAEEANDTQIAAVCRHFAGQYYFLNEEYGKAFEHLLAANRAFRELGYGRIPEISRYLYELAFNYYYFKEYEKVIGLLTEAARRPAFNSNLAIQTYNTLGLAHASRFYTLKNRHDGSRAETDLLKARAVAVLHRDSLWIGIIQRSLADLYVNRGQWAAALQAYQSDYRLGLRFGSKRHYFPHVAALNMAAMFWHLSKPDSCLYYLNRSRRLYRLNKKNPDFGSNLNDEYYLRAYYDVSRQYYHALNNQSQAYRFADSLLRIKDRLNERYDLEQVALAEKKLLMEKHQSEIKIIEGEKNAGRTVFWIAGTACALMALLFYRLYRLSRIKHHQEKVINAEKEKSFRLEKQIISDELERARTDLAFFVANLAEKNALIDVITAKLEAISSPGEPSEQRQFLEAQQNLVNSSLLTNDDWAEFRRRFERVHPSFFVQLRNQYADLSPAEERLLALAKLNMDTHQMSRMLGVAPDSIRKTKYRLRKKLGLDGTSPLSSLLKEA